MQIREFRIEDFTAVIALWQDAGLELNRSDSFEGIRRKIERDPDLFLVSEEDGQILAAIMAGFDGRRGWVYHMAVHAYGQGRGWGALLLEELQQRLKAKGCEKINLLLEPSYTEVIAFFEKQNYRHNDLIFMEKWL
jgi:ribosomal protein S18 acetylase RimI-like enzyme